MSCHMHGHFDEEKTAFPTAYFRIIFFIRQKLISLNPIAKQKYCCHQLPYVNCNSGLLYTKT